MNNGIINILKPAGMTSFDVVSAIKRLFGTKKVGHTGTLDPMATGVLPICIDKGTRIIKYLENDGKKYRCEVQFGFETDTQDAWGKILTRSKVDLDEDTIRKAARYFIGEISQTPPIYSAIRINGKRLYEYARSGEIVTPKSRKITIEKFEIINIDLENQKMMFDIDVSKGTYIRTICYDLGQMLGCGAIMTFLSRSRSGIFNLEEAVSLEEVTKMYNEGRIEEILKPLDFPLRHLPKGEIIDPIKAKEVICGGYIQMNDIRQEGLETYEGFFTLYYNGELIAVSSYDKDLKKIIADKVFVQNIDNQ
ncbi:MAG: tRNA pseudouridine(55) synthase TruB [Eubacteriales bacterium]